MNARIKELRSALALSQTAFGERIGLSRSEINNIERSVTDVKEKIVPIIVREFCVDEHWLRTGEGEMFCPKDREEEVFSWVGSVLGKSDDDIRKKLLTAFASVPDEKWQLLEEFVKSLQQK